MPKLKNNHSKNYNIIQKLKKNKNSKNWNFFFLRAKIKPN